MRKENEDILPKIKKFVAVGPPFAGSSELQIKSVIINFFLN
jgi:hypothetical protein